MAIANSLSEARNIAAVERQLKLRLERYFRPIIRRYLRDLNNDNRLFYARNGYPLNTAEYNQELASLLRAYYRRISNVFKLSLRTKENSALMDDIINQEIKLYNDERAQQSAFIINNTNQKELAAAIAASQILLQQDGRIASNKLVADAAAKDFSQKIPGRGDLISVTETQNVAETTKYIEATNILRAPEAVGAIGLRTALSLDKIWIADLDDRTRDAHARADGQRVANGGLFTVWNEQLAYPGDMLHGATLKNVANCRCSLVFMPQR